ncbi:unnamed protein product [Fraxinus pennsylvanica]|uniref:WAT1-related protein n=1 Tax=Fraxinus pennsylvanica TaxID=56036 RepID=A0AAD2DSV3_9LAMI|nr:unnamed protein product [Fraxinus pennsylvanica]
MEVNLKKSIMSVRVLIGMLVVQVIATGLQLLSRVILSQGTFLFALLAYRNAVGAICVLPFALYWERDGLKKDINGYGIILFGTKGHHSYICHQFLESNPSYHLYLLNYPKYILRSVLSGLLRTFIKETSLCGNSIFLVLRRIEKLRVNTKAGKVKTLGAVICLAGALTIALYKGKAFHFHHFRQQNTVIRTVREKKTRGTLLLVGSVLSYGMWFTTQVKLFKVFPYKFCATMLTCVIASIQQVIIGLCITRKPEAWKLGWNLQLITIVYSGILATAATFCLISWAISERGPTYPSMFNPLSLILVAILEALFLGEPITVGSSLGMCLIIVGLYSFLWGKSKEPKSKPAGTAKEGGIAVPQPVGLESVTIVMPADTKIRNVEDDKQNATYAMTR